MRGQYAEDIATVGDSKASKLQLLPETSWSQYFSAKLSLTMFIPSNDTGFFIPFVCVGGCVYVSLYIYLYMHIISLSQYPMRLYN